MSYAGTSRFSYEERRSLGSHTIPELEEFSRLEPQNKPLLDLLLSWLVPAHAAYSAAYHALKNEASEDKKVVLIDTPLTDLLNEGIEEIFDAFEIILRKARLSKNKELLSSVQLSIQSLTDGKTKSDLKTPEKQTLFLDDLHARLPEHPHLHLKSEEIDLLPRINELHTQAHAAKQGIVEVKADTHKARRLLWEKAQAWDIEYTASKALFRGLLIHLRREDDLKRFFKDSAPSRSSQESDEPLPPPPPPTPANS